MHKALNNITKVLKLIIIAHRCTVLLTEVQWWWYDGGNCGGDGDDGDDGDGDGDGDDGEAGNDDGDDNSGENERGGQQSPP